MGAKWAPLTLVRWLNVVQLLEWRRHEIQKFEWARPFGVVSEHRRLRNARPLARLFAVVCRVDQADTN